MFVKASRTCLTIYLLGILFGITSCSSSEAQKTVDKAIEAHGGEKFEKAKISFDFRDRHYVIFKGASGFEYSREFTDSTGQVVDILNNNGFTRTIDGKEVELSPERKTAYSNSVNSVAYFAFLPYGLNDPAVYKEYLGESEISGNSYHLIKINFSPGGGGKDFEDEFLYWLNKQNNRIDYLAYNYLTDGGGVRFRKAINPRMIEGILIQDYENYKPSDKNTPLEELENLFEKGDLELLSEIRLENVQITIVE